MTQVALNIAVITVSDTRTHANDSSGSYLKRALIEAGHSCVDYMVIPDDVYHMRAILSQHIYDEQIQVVLMTGGTGFSHRDSTPEAVTPLLDKTVPGFGELFRKISYQEIGTSTIQSRALAGISNKTLIFCLPGSTGACRTAWNEIIKDQLNSENKPCNFVTHLVD